MAKFRREVDVHQFATITQVRVAARRVDGVTVNLSDLQSGLLWLEGPEEAVNQASEELLRIVAAGTEDEA
jgi:hypothetical protein